MLGLTVVGSHVPFHCQRLVGVAIFAYEFTPSADPAGALTAVGLLNLLVLLLLYFATLKR